MYCHLRREDWIEFPSDEREEEEKDHMLLGREANRKQQQHQPLQGALVSPCNQPACQLFRSFPSSVSVRSNQR